MGNRRWVGGVVALVALVGGVVPTAARAATDPVLDVPIATLTAALSCPATFAHVAQHAPVLLVHGTSVTADENWGWNYGRILPLFGYDVCLVNLPDRAMSDIQRAAEYVVFAIRSMYQRAGRPIDMIGHSQGSLEPRWALKFWPSLWSMVDDFIMLAGPDHGTSSANGLCAAGSCFPAAWQMSIGSHFIAALNRSDESPGPVSYTSVASIVDELVQPYTSVAVSGPTDKVKNILIQDLCPGRPVHHVGQSYDAVVFAVVRDALDLPGPAQPKRFFAARLCAKTFMPGLSADDVAAGNALVYSSGAHTVAVHPMVDHEPPLRVYAT